MKKYNEFQLKILYLECNDVVTASGPAGDEFERDDFGSTNGVAFIDGN